MSQQKQPSLHDTEVNSIKRLDGSVYFSLPNAMSNDYHSVWF